MFAWACAVLAFLIVAGISLVVFFHWGGAIPRLQRYALAGIAAGLAWAGIPRLLGRPPGPGDLLLLASLGLYLALRYGPEILRHADRLDGRDDGRLGFTWFAFRASPGETLNITRRDRP